MPDIGRRRRFLINAAYGAVIAGGVLLFFRYLLRLLWPFILAFFFARLLTPVIRWLTERRRWRRDLAAALCLFVFFALLGGLAARLTARLAALAADAVTWLPTLYSDAVAPGLEALSAALEELARRFGPDAYDLVSAAAPSVLSSIGSAVTGASMKLVTALSGWAARLPSCLMSALICVIATIFMTVDYPRMTAFLLRQVPERPRRVIGQARAALRSVAHKYGRGYAIILGVTFLELLAGLLVLRQKNALLLAAAIALFDIFPIVGAGMILCPWGAVCLLGGRVGKGAGLLILYGVEIVARQIIEPRIVGRQVGLHPLVTLAAMFVGTRLLGPAGLIGLPVTCAILASLDDAGVIRILRRENASRSVPPGGTPPSVPPAGNGEK